MSFSDRYEQKRIKPVRWSVVVYSILLSEAVTLVASLVWGKFLPVVFILGVIVPLIVAPGMMYHSYKLRERLIAQLVESDGRLRASLAEKEELMQEVHHRVKNNMAVIMGFLGLQSRYTDDPEAVRILKESQDRIRSMALVHEKLRLDSGHVKLDIENYIRSLLDGLLYSYAVTEQPVASSVDVADVPLDIRTTINCGLIINELVTNSLKYAFEGVEAPEIRVKLRQDGDALVLSVGDNGCGIPAGLNVNGGKTLGLKIVGGLVSQIDGTLLSENSGGTTFHVRFPGSEGA